MFTSKAVLALAAISFLAPAQDATYNLRQKHVEGHTSVYEMETLLDSEGFNMNLQMKLKYKVTKVEADGAYEEEETVLEGKAVYNGQEEAIPAEEPTIRKYDKDGNEIKENKEEEEGGSPLEALFDLLDGSDPKDPVKVGQKWEVEDDDRKSSFEFIGAEKLEEVNTLKTLFTGKLKQTGVSGDVSGTIWLRAADASLEKLELKTENYVPGEGAGVGKVVLKIKRVE